MPCFAMICFGNMYLSCSKHCFLMLNSWDVDNFTKSVTCYLLHFCHACLNLLLSELAVARCSSFVKHLDWISAMYFVAMLECCSMLFLMHLDGLVLLIAALCHYCFACHLQTVHPIPVIFISISTKIISSFQRNTWFAKFVPCSSFSFRSTHKHCISHLAYHDMYCIMLLVHCTMIYCGSFACVLALGRAGRRVRERGTCWERLRGSSLQQLWELCRQDDHTFDITSIFAC